jgi:succinate dehydrogenase/fumarate reductase flavoprotein subunit
MLGYRAGAEISGLEYTMVSYLIKDINTPLLYIVLTRGAHLFNAFDTPLHDNHPNISMMLAEYMADRGPCRINMSHLPESKIKEVEDILFATERPAMERFFKGRNVDFRSGEIELWFTECYLCGGHGLTGLVVNERAECSIPGLYAAGDTSLVARGHLSGALVFGMISAEQASAFAERAPKPVLEEDQVEAIIADQKAKLSQDKNPVAVEEFEFKVRRLISDYIRPPKNSYKLKRALWWVERFRQEARTMVRVQNMHDLFKLYEVENIIQCAKLSATASLERAESRWGMWHFRSDFPKRDDANWLKHIILKRGEDAWDPQISHRAISKMEVRQ